MDLLAVILMLVFVTSAICLSLPPVVKSDLTDNLGLSDPQYGLLSTVFLALYGISGFTSGILAARWGGRLLLVCCGCFFLGSLVFGLSSNMGGFLVGRALQGLGGGMVIATCSPTMAQAIPPKWLNRAWGILGAGWGLGSAVALLVMPSIENAGGYRAVFLTTAGLAFVVGLAALSQKAVRMRPSHPEGATTLRGLLLATGSVITNRKVLLLGFINAAALAVGVSVLAFTPSFLQDVHGAGKDISIYLLAGLGAAQVVGNPVGAWATARWGKFAVILLSMVPMVIVTAVVGIVPGVALTFVMVLLAGLLQHELLSPDAQLHAGGGGQALAGGSRDRSQHGAGFRRLDALPLLLRPHPEGRQGIPRRGTWWLSHAGRVRGAGHRLDGLLQGQVSKRPVP